MIDFRAEGMDPGESLSDNPGPIFARHQPPLRKNAAGNRRVEKRLALDATGGDFVLYLSIPFCRVRCYACPYFVDLLSLNDPLDKEGRYVDSLVKDLERWASHRRWQTGRLRAIYIGGGTGSILSTSSIKRIVSTIFDRFPVDERYELTLEGNAHDYTTDKLDYVAESQITRVSLGVQSFTPEALTVIGSPHAAEESVQAINELSERGFDNIQLDMMYNFPGHRRETWQKDLERLRHLNIKHFTVYSYRVHEGTPQHKFIKLGKVPPIRVRDSHYVKDMYADVIGAAEAMGFQMYMFDYFALPGWEERYLSWMIRHSDVDLLGVGPGAYGFINNYRLATGRNVEEYLATVHRGEHMISAVSDRLSPQARRERYVSNMLQCFAINFSEYFKNFRREFLDDFASEAEEIVDRGLATLDDKELRLTKAGKEWHQRRVAYGRSKSGMRRSPR